MRHYKRKTDRGTKSLDRMTRAAMEVKNVPLRRVARDYDICRMSLKRFIARYLQNPDTAAFVYSTPRLVFSSSQETILTDYLLKLAQIFHGISPKEVRRLAYDCAIKCQINIPETWNENKMAGKDWLNGFMKINRCLSLRKPEDNSLSRPTSFNKANVDNFFKKLADVMDRYKFSASSIWNVDETGVFTWLDDGSGIFWFYATFCCIKQVRCSKEYPMLLLLENYSSHLSINTLDLDKENGISLDVAVYGPFKRHLSSAQDAWMRNHPARIMTVYDIQSIVRTVVPLSLSQTNIIKGFEATGTYPFSQDIFQESDYAPRFVTDRPEVVNEQGGKDAEAEKENVLPETLNDPSV
ncbi:hypothetical protein NQ318_010782 [Aromia moschata]|uniref:DDE-1 domain-containing protein n=1 Tax=Aromia moschata TaxID=1265417 RepID=A0AAV8YZE4_9CUCU|nr:hypothetical protein NQ318_010782 [Aromia moschata]